MEGKKTIKIIKSNGNLKRNRQMERNMRAVVFLKASPKTKQKTKNKRKTPPTAAADRVTSRRSRRQFQRGGTLSSRGAADLRPSVGQVGPRDPHWLEKKTTTPMNSQSGTESSPLLSTEPALPVSRVTTTHPPISFASWRLGSLAGTTTKQWTALPRLVARGPIRSRNWWPLRQSVDRNEMVPGLFLR